MNKPYSSSYFKLKKEKTCHFTIVKNCPQKSEKNNLPILVAFKEIIYVLAYLGPSLKIA